MIFLFQSAETWGIKLKKFPRTSKRENMRGEKNLIASLFSFQRGKANRRTLLKNEKIIPQK